jgi:hypothetical protein
LKNRGDTYTDRLETQAKAKQALLEKARLKDPANDPEFAARQQARIEAAKVREERELERRIAKEEEREKLRLEREAEAARKAEEARLAAEAAAIEAERIRRGGRPISKMGSGTPSSKPPKPQLTPEEQKAARDARYAARKARKKR